MIDLGQDSPDYRSPVTEKMETKKCYPSLYFTCDKEYDIPDDGTATIKFRKIEDSENVRDPEDPKYRYELEVQGIDIKGMKMDMEEPDTDVGAALKKAIKQKRAIVIEEDGDDE